MNTFKTLRNHGRNAEQQRPLGCPVAAGAGAVLLSGDDHERHPLLLIAHGRVIDREHFTIRKMPCIAPFLLRHHFVAQTGIGKGATHHDFMIAAPRAVGIEIADGNALLLQIPPRRAFGTDGAGWRDMVGRDGITEERENTHLFRQFFRLTGSGTLEKRWFFDIG